MLGVAFLQPMALAALVTAGLPRAGGLDPGDAEGVQLSEDELRLTEPGVSSVRPRNLRWAALETAGIIVGGAIWYWSDLDFNSRDWDLQWDWPSWKSKLTFESLRFDQNLFETNTNSHIRAGFYHYQVARGNGMSAGASLATSFVRRCSGSTWWSSRNTPRSTTSS
jgi:hypothetical protein